MQHIEEVVLLEKKGNLGIVSLNRPKKLNSLTRELTSKLREILRICEEDTNISMVLLRGSGEKAFSAGGDLVAAGHALQEEGIEAAVQSFKKEYRSGKIIAEYSKPIIAYMDGITMGGGVGLAIACDVKIATERTHWAMPEVKIGFFPDVGVSYFFARMKSFFGVYLAVTGKGIRGEDCCLIGAADIQMESKNYEALLKDLIEISKENLEKNSRLERIKEVAIKYSKTKEVAYLEKNRKEIEMFFSKESLIEIKEALIKGKASSFAKECLEEMEKNSPLSMVVSFEQVKSAKNRSLGECYEMDGIMAKHFLEGKEMFEGVRALLVEKTKNPNWEYSSIEKVPKSLVLSYFQE